MMVQRPNVISETGKYEIRSNTIVASKLITQHQNWMLIYGAYAAQCKSFCLSIFIQHYVETVKRLHKAH